MRWLVDANSRRGGGFLIATSCWRPHFAKSAGHSAPTAAACISITCYSRSSKVFCFLCETTPVDWLERLAWCLCARETGCVFLPSVCPFVCLSAKKLVSCASCSPVWGPAICTRIVWKLNQTQPTTIYLDVSVSVRGLLIETETSK